VRQPPRRERVCFIRMNYFPEEAHVRKNAEALTEAGYDVDIICLRQKGEKPREDHGSGRIYRLPLSHKRSGALRYVFEYGAFFAMAFWLVTFLHLRKRYKIVETYNVPDVIVFVALVPRLLGAKLVLRSEARRPRREVYALDGAHQRPFRAQVGRRGAIRARDARPARR